MPIVFEQPRPFDIRYYPMGGGRGGGVSGAPSGGGGDRGGGGGGKQPSGGGGREKGGGDEGQDTNIEGIDLQPGEDAIGALEDREQAQYDYEMDQDTATRQAEEQGSSEFDEAGTGYVPGTPQQEEDGGVQVQPTQDSADDGGDWGGGGESDEGDDTGDPGGGDPEAAAPDSQPGYKQTPNASMPPPTVQAGQPGPNTPGAQRPPPRPQPQQPPPPPEFTQADALDLARLQNSQAQLRQRLRNGELDIGTARRVSAMINNGIKPLQALQQVAQQRRDADAHDKLMHAEAAQAAMQNMNATQTAQHVRDHTAPLPNGGSVYTDPAGRTHIIAPPHADNTERNTERDEARARERAQALNERAGNHVTADMNKDEKAFRDLPPSQQPAWLNDPDARERERRDRIQRYIREAGGSSGTQTQQNAAPAAQQGQNTVVTPAMHAARQRLDQQLSATAMPSQILRPPAPPRGNQLVTDEDETFLGRLRSQFGGR